MKTSNYQFIIILFFVAVSVNAQIKVREDDWVQIGYESYAPLSLGIGGSPNNGQWVIESWNGTLNFARPSGVPNAGNYKFFIRDDNGNVGIGLSNNSPTGKLHVNNTSNANGTYGVYAVTPKPGNGTYHVRSIAGYTTSGGGYSYGVYGSATNASLQTSGRAWGVYGIAGNATNGYNYGVYGRLNGTGNGAAIYGAIEGESDYDITGKYAAYFRGNVKCEDMLWAYDLQESDIRIKKDIKQLEGSLDKLCKLNGISYKLKSKEEISRDLGMTTSDTSIVNKDTSLLRSINHIGLSAQEVQDVFKELVFKGQDGVLGIHYSGLVPVIIESVKELNSALKIKSDSLQTIRKDMELLKQQVEKISIQLKKCCPENLKSADNDLLKGSMSSNSLLFQNTPNPFNIDTKIAMFIDTEVLNAILYIFDIQGKYISSHSIAERGNTEVTISGSNLRAGMYLYTLMVDGNEIDTKRMILTE